MVVYCGTISARTKGELDFVDLTGELRDLVEKSRIKNGVVTLFVPGATGAIVINENEDNVIEDFRAAVLRLAPDDAEYRHGSNARSHVGAMVLGPSETIPVKDCALEMGTWQSVFLVELDVRPRSREVVVRVVGSSAVHES